MKLVDDIGAIWKRWSVRILAAQVVLAGTWGGLVLIGWAPTVPDWAKWAAFAILGAAGLSVAHFQQGNLPKSQMITEGEGFARKPESDAS